MKIEGGLHQETFGLIGVLLQCLESETPQHAVVREHLAKTGLAVLDEVTALGLRPTPDGFDRLHEGLAMLHVQLELAHALEILTQKDFVALAGQLETVGASLTRWQRKVGL